MPELESKTFARVLSAVAVLAFFALAAFVLVEISTRVRHISLVSQVNGDSHSDLTGVIASLWVVGFFGFGFAWKSWFGGRQWLGRLVGLFLALVVVVLYKGIIASAATQTSHGLPPKRQAVSQAQLDAELAELAPMVEALRNFQAASPIPSTEEIRKALMEGTLDDAALRKQIQTTMVEKFPEAASFTSYGALALFLAAKLRTLEDLARISTEACVAELEGRASSLEVLAAAQNPETTKAVLTAMTAVFRDAAARAPRPKPDPALVERASRTVMARLEAEGIDSNALNPDVATSAEQRCAAYRALFKHTLALPAPARAQMIHHLLTGS